MAHFEINCDMGEKAGNDALLMPYLDACSIACSGHAGDEKSIRETVLLARQHQVKIGAHPSFPDKKNFGRKVMPMDANDLIASLKGQIQTFLRVCKELNVKVDHLKPHGALYNLASKDEKTAMALIQSMQGLENVTLLAPWKSVIARLASDAGIQVKLEGFADRTYTNDLTLVSRDNPNSIISDPQKSAKQVLGIFKDHRVESIDGEMVELHAETFCVHGDNPMALELVKKLNAIKNAT